MTENKENNNKSKIEEAIGRLELNENTIYFLTYDTRNNPRAAVKHIYDLALTLKENGNNVKILVEDNKYSGVSGWLGDKYNSLDVATIKDDKVNINIDDVIVVPEYYSNILPQLSSIKCVKVMLIQQKEYIYETLPIGSKWYDYGFDKVITTTEASKKYILEFFPESDVFIIPPIIGDEFKPLNLPLKPYVAISCRDRNVNKKLISEFYLKYPQLRWITFKDMVQLSYAEFAASLRECMVSIWVDDESTFGTFPLESMKVGVPVVGKIPNTEPDWLSENGMWTYDSNKLVEILGTYILANIEGVELKQEVIDKMNETLLPYNTETTKNTINSVFNSIKNLRIKILQNTLEKIKE